MFFREKAAINIALTANDIQITIIQVNPKTNAFCVTKAICFATAVGNASNNEVKACAPDAVLWTRLACIGVNVSFDAASNCVNLSLLKVFNNALERVMPAEAPANAIVNSIPVTRAD